MEIQYLDDDGTPPSARPPRLPPRSASVPEKDPPIPGGLGSAWYYCANDQCSRYGHVASASDEPIHKVEWRGCPDKCIGGVDPGTEKPCLTCGGRGKVATREWDEPPEIECPWCKRQMEFLRKGAQPMEYPRMGLPDVAESDFSGNVSFGRKRVVSDG